VKIWKRFNYTKRGFRSEKNEKRVEAWDVTEAYIYCSVCEAFVYSGLISVIIAHCCLISEECPLLMFFKCVRCVSLLVFTSHRIRAATVDSNVDNIVRQNSFSNVVK
jgi:hypothetical protein